MANWVKDFLTQNPGKADRIVKRDRYALHTRNSDGSIQAMFTGAPIHYLDDSGNWQPIDTAIQRLADGKLGAPGIPITFDENGGVYLTDYSQATRRIGIYNVKTGAFESSLNSSKHIIDDDKLIQDFGAYKHVITLKEDGIREELVINSAPDVSAASDDLWLMMDTVVTGHTFANGWQNDEYQKGKFRFVKPKAFDAEQKEVETKRFAYKAGKEQHLLTGIPLSALQKVAFPITLDPDFSGSTNDGYIYGVSASYSSARSNSNSFSVNEKIFVLGQAFWSLIILFIEIISNLTHHLSQTQQQ